MHTMFANIRQIYKMSDKALVRTIRGKLGHRTPSVGPNPGLDHRIKAFKKDGVSIEDDDAEEFVENSNSDLLNISESYNEHMNETFMGKYIKRHQIVKDKYFKENMPNLLTWSEKEQIRLLNSQHPHEWTPQKIAESFPVTEAVVKKLLKYPWKPSTESRIARHDNSALRNWKELKDGTLSISEDLRQHFLKFSNRTIPPLSKKSTKIDLTKQEKIGEFQKIIERCAANENLNSHNQVEQEKSERHTDCTKDNNTSKDYKRTTLDELANKIRKRLENNKEVELPDQLILNTIDSTSVTVCENGDSNQIELENNDEKALSNVKNSNEVLNVSTYPERIRVPKKAFKKGATYKVNDCYYDDDGRFLYRVIGMSN